nr:chitinase [Agrotis ipsilon]
MANRKAVVCYYGSWATYRNGPGKFDVTDINPKLCTHLIYAFAGMNTEGNIVPLDAHLDLPDNYGRDNYRKFNDLKKQNKNLKTLLAVGGWNLGSAKFSTMAASSSLRKNFVNSAVNILSKYGFDGLDLDWEYPNQRDTVNGAADVGNFTTLCRELRSAFDRKGYLLTAAVAAGKSSASRSYDIRGISKYLDMVNLMTYDMNGGWDNVTGHNAPLHKGEGDQHKGSDDVNTVELALKYWIGAGCPPEKIVLGVPFYGRTFKLKSASQAGVRAPTSGSGMSGQYTTESGFLGYNEIASKFQSESWTKRFDSLAKVPYAVKGQDWLSYDDPKSITAKIEFAKRLNINKVMVWEIETDDFRGSSGGGTYPLLKAINNALGF